VLCKSDTREIAGKVREFGPKWEKLSSERSTKVTPTEVDTHQPMRKIRPLDGLIEALGATGADIHRMVLWQGLRLGLAGTLLGLAAAFVAARALEGYLYGIGEHDPGSFAAATFVLLTASLFSRLLPARRAARVDPVIALRGE